MRGPLLLAGGLLAASVVLHLRDPHQPASYGLCPWLFLTGTSCPGCGGLRAVHDLTDGDLAAAASSNLLLVGSLPLAAWWWARRVRDAWRGVLWQPQTATYARAALLLAGVLVAWWVVRNLPGLTWLAP